MKLEDIISEWKNDSQISQLKIREEISSVPLLHCKYMEWFVNEKLILKKMEASFKTLKNEKYEFYTQGHTKETKDKGWELPSKGMILKSEIQQYLDSDKDIINLNLKISVQETKVELLESIIKSIQNRGYLLRTYVDYVRFESGA